MVRFQTVRGIGGTLQHDQAPDPDGLGAGNVVGGIPDDHQLVPGHAGIRFPHPVPQGLGKIVPELADFPEGAAAVVEFLFDAEIGQLGMGGHFAVAGEQQGGGIRILPDPLQGLLYMGQEMALFFHQGSRQLFSVGLEHPGHFFRGAAALDPLDGLPGDVGVRPSGHAVGEFKIVQTVQVDDGGFHGGHPGIIGEQQGTVNIPADVFHGCSSFDCQKQEAPTRASCFPSYSLVFFQVMNFFSLAPAFLARRMVFTIFFRWGFMSLMEP